MKKLTKERRDEIVRWIYDDHGIPMWLSRKIVSKVADLILNANTEQGEHGESCIKCGGELHYYLIGQQSNCRVSECRVCIDCGKLEAG